MRKTDAGTRSTADVIRIAGVDYVGANRQPSASSYIYLHQMHETNPATGMPWTISDVNGGGAGGEYGIKVTV